MISRAFRNFNPVKFLKTIVNPSAVRAKISSIQTINKLEKEEAAYFCLSYGCPNQCTYCAKTRAFGRLKSKPVEDCLAEYQKILANGTRRIAFTADDTGSYGLDLHSDLPTLLNALVALHGEKKVQWIFKNFHPKWIIKYQQQLSPFIEQGLLTDLVVPIESGSNNILIAMNRNHTIENLKTALIHFRTLQPGLTLRTHVMIGFPGETEYDFEQTLTAIKTIGFNWVTFFRYYDAEGTTSAGMAQKVPEVMIRKRLKKMKSFMKKNHIPWL
jgi:tRNA A37 methylthiotransferase MiaB